MRLRNIAVAIAAAAILALTFMHAKEAGAGVNVSIGINLPALAFPEPPPVVVIPGTYAYYAPGVDVDILFYGGYWYRPYEGRWFRARSYNGPWGYIATARVPSVFLHLPPDYRRARPVYEPIPDGQLKKHWRTWERERHWDRAAGPHDRRDWHRESGQRGYRAWQDNNGHGHRGRSRY